MENNEILKIINKNENEISLSMNDNNINNNIKSVTKDCTFEKIRKLQKLVKKEYALKKLCKKKYNLLSSYSNQK